MYNIQRAKIAANLHWLFSKSYGIDHIPEDMRDPFYTDQYEQEHIKPPVIRLLVSSELYCNVLGLILKEDQKASLHSHTCVIQALAYKDIYVKKRNYRPVTDVDLARTPIELSSHMHMIDALMMAYTVEMISKEKVVTCVKRFCEFQSKELPLNVEETMIFWINKVNSTMKEISKKEYKVKQHPLNSASHQKVRSHHQLPHFPMDLMRVVCDGAALLTVVHFYCPDLMNLDDICLKEDTSAADRLYNIQLLKEFANQFLNKSFYLTVEDMLYLPPVLKPNVMVFIAELFSCFEIVKPEFVHQRDEQNLTYVAQSERLWLSMSVSSATKKSFQVSTRMAKPTHLVPNASKVCNTEEPDPSNKEKFSPPKQLVQLREKQQNYQEEEDTSAFPTGNDDSQRGLRQKGGTRDGPSSSARRRLVCWAKAQISCLWRFLCRCFPFFSSYYSSPEQSSKDDCLDAVPNKAEEKKTEMILFQDEQKTEEEMAEKRASLLLNQQKRAKKAELIKQELQAKRTEARRKTEEKQIMNQDNKARRELIKERHLKNKYQWQNPPNPKPKESTPATFSTDNKDRQHGSPQRGGSRDGPSSSARQRPPSAHNQCFSISSSSDCDKTVVPVPSSPGQSHTYKPTVISNVKSAAEQSLGVYQSTSVAEEVLCAGQSPKLRKADLQPVMDSKVKRDSLPQSVRQDRSKHGQKLNVEKDSCLDAVPTDVVYEEKKTGMCFVIENEQKAEHIMDKKRAAFLLNQQKRAEEVRLLKKQREAEIELKRTEARRKAEQERIMKEDDQARRELIKQEHLKQKYQWQNPPNPKPNPKKQRPKSVRKKKFFTDTLPTSTPATFPTGNEDSQHGSPQRGGSRDGPSFLAGQRPQRVRKLTFNVNSSSDLSTAFSNVPPSARKSHTYKSTVISNVKSAAEQSLGVYLNTSVAEEVLCAGQSPKLRKADLLPVMDSKVKRDSLPQFVSQDRSKHGQKLNVENDSCLDAVPTDVVYEEKKTGMCFVIENEQETEHIMEKKRAAFLLNQQQRAEEVRLLKQQREAEIELKRTEARRKAEQERIMKEEDKARRELMKQEHLKQKYQWQNPPNPKPNPKKRRPKY